MIKPTQLTLPLQWPDSATFANFYRGDNQQAVAYLQQFTTLEPVVPARMPGSNPQGCETFTSLWSGSRHPCRDDVRVVSNTQVYLHGDGVVGLSHLLRASCHAINQQGLAAAYVPLGKPGFSPEILEGMENMALLCLDDIEKVAANPSWEEALFHCYNRLQQNSVRLIIAGHAPPSQLPWCLADLKSRLTACLIFHLKPLTDDQKILALQQRAQTRGFTLPPTVATYLLNHHSRTPHALFNALEKLDQASLSIGRRLTIPFVKEVL